MLQCGGVLSLLVCMSVYFTAETHSSTQLFSLLPSTVPFAFFVREQHPQRGGKGEEQELVGWLVSYENDDARNCKSYTAC